MSWYHGSPLRARQHAGEWPPPARLADVPCAAEHTPPRGRGTLPPPGPGQPGPGGADRTIIPAGRTARRTGCRWRRRHATATRTLAPLYNAHKVKLGGESIRKTKADLTKGQKPAK